MPKKTNEVYKKNNKQPKTSQLHDESARIQCLQD